VLPASSPDEYHTTGNEHGLQGRYAQHVRNVLGPISEGLKLNVRMADYLLAARDGRYTEPPDFNPVRVSAEHPFLLDIGKLILSHGSWEFLSCHAFRHPCAHLPTEMKWRRGIIRHKNPWDRGRFSSEVTMAWQAGVHVDTAAGQQGINTGMTESDAVMIGDRDGVIRVVGEVKTYWTFHPRKNQSDEDYLAEKLGLYSLNSTLVANRAQRR
jgi:hypothetical protein